MIPFLSLPFFLRTVSFLDVPEFDIDLKTIAGVDVMDLPGIRTFVRFASEFHVLNLACPDFCLFSRDMLSGGIIEEYMIWPKKIEFDLSSEIEIPVCVFSSTLPFFLWTFFFFSFSQSPF